MHFLIFREEKDKVFLQAHAIMMRQVRPVREMTVLEQKAYILFYVRDRRNIIPRKPVDVTQKEYFKSNVAGNKIAPTDNNLSKEPIQKNLVERRSSELVSSIAQKDASTIVPRVPHLKESSVNQNNGHIVTENMVPKKEPVSKSFSKASSKGPLGGLGEDMLPSTPLPSSKGGISVSVNAMVATTGAKINDCNEKASSNDNESVSIMISPTVKDPEIFEASNEISQNVSGCY